ncbi:MAG: nucleotidyltransferase family protein [Alphaproteobacteria bacterium]|nr:nucleotidyltransferase family protein [Alphaproteobacteria bacterium]
MTTLDGAALLPPEGELPPGMITPDQEELLRILYSPDEIAAPLFERWQARVDMTDLDDGCYRLYPYLYRRIRGFAPDHPFLGRLKGLFRRSLYRNNMLFQWAREVLERLRAAEIDCIVLKGAALVRSIGLSAGFRPMADVDLLVRPGDARRAMEVADPLFRRILDDPVGTMARIQLRHGASIMDDRRLEIDMHWRIGDVWAPGDDPDAPFWETAQPVELSGATALALAPTELLYHVVVHGLSWNALPTVRWISDALDIMAAEGDLLDWHRLVALAERYHRRATVRVALAYVRHRFAGPVPDWVLAALGPPYDAREAADFRQEMLPWKTPVDMADVRLLAPDWLARMRERVPGRRCIVFLPDRMATPDVMGWIGSIGADHICEFPADGVVMKEVRRRIVESEQWRRGFYGRPGALLRIDPGDALPAGLSGPVYVRVWRKDEQWRIRAFVSSLRDWPVGAPVLRLDSVVGFRKPSLLGREDAVPTPCLPAWPGFPEGALTATPAGVLPSR